LDDTPYHPGGAPGNCFDGNTYTAYKPNATNQLAQMTIDVGSEFACDFLAISGLIQGADFRRITLFASLLPDDFTDQVYIAGLDKVEIDAGVHTVTTGNTIPFRYYRFTIENNTAPVTDTELSNALFGNVFVLQHGIAAPYTPPKLSTKSEVTNNKTMGGHFVGRSVLTGQYDFIIKNKNVTPEWINANWQYIHDQILTKPFMYSWDDSKPEDAVFCWTKGDIPPPKYDNQCYFSFSIPCNGFIEND